MTEVFKYVTFFLNEDGSVRLGPVGRFSFQFHPYRTLTKSTTGLSSSFFFFFLVTCRLTSGPKLGVETFVDKL